MYVNIDKCLLRVSQIQIQENNLKSNEAMPCLYNCLQGCILSKKKSNLPFQKAYTPTKKKGS